MAENSTTSSSNDGPLIDTPEQATSTWMGDGSRRWLYPTPSRGFYWYARQALGWALIALFTALPIIRIGGEPAVLLDVINRRFVIFGAVFHATDTVFLMLFLLIAMVSIGVITALFGRVWCGWGCPQTVYLEFVFRPIERLFEGSEQQRKSLDQRDWDFDKLWRKAGKHASYLVIALGLAHTFVAYFVGWDALVRWMTGPPGEHFGFFFMMAFTTGLILFDFAYFREQMCVTVCPYAKLQSVMMDRDSMIVSYDPNRGEPRGRRSREQRKKEQSGEDIALGDCIDCGACVRTCPTGIDIREGLQMECVSCTQCIDACNDIMHKIGKPGGLIRYASEREIEDDESPRFLRPRVIAYSILLVSLIGIFGFMLTRSQEVELDVLRTAGTTFERQTIEQTPMIRSRIRFRVRNKLDAPAAFSFEARTPEGTELKVIGPPSYRLDVNEMRRIEAFVFVPESAYRDSASVEGTFAVMVDGTEKRTISMPLPGPEPSADSTDSTRN